MSGGLNISLVEFSKSKLDDVLIPIQTLTTRTNQIEEFFTELNNSHRSETSPTMLSSSAQRFLFTESSMRSIPKETPSAQHGNNFKIKEPRISLLEKFDSTRSSSKDLSIKSNLICCQGHENTRQIDR